MVTIISIISKYLIIIMGAIYTLSCFTIFRPINITRQKVLLNRQLRHLLIFHFLCYFVLFLHTNQVKIIWFYFAQILFITIVQVVYHQVYPKASRLITNNMCFLLTLGFTILTRLNFDLAVKQYMIVCGTVFLCLPVPYVIKEFKQLGKYRILYGVVGFSLLASVFLIGARKNGAVNWIKIGSFMFQPSEFVKILFVFFISSMLVKSNTFKQIVITTFCAAAHVIVLVLEKDLGGALLFFIVYLIMLFVATGKKLYLFAGLSAGGVAAILAYHLFSHVQTRVEAWSNPWSIIDGGGNQIAQSLFAIGTGSWLGMGLDEGMPYKIPVVVSDFIFSAIAEELGTIFALCLLLICVSCFISFMDIAMQSRKMEYKLLSVGFAVSYIFQVFLSVGGVTKFIPSTGVTLPLVSYGGSSVVSSILIFYLIQGLYMNTHCDEKRERKIKKFKIKQDRKDEESGRKQRQEI